MLGCECAEVAIAVGMCIGHVKTCINKLEKSIIHPFQQHLQQMKLLRQQEIEMVVENVAATCAHYFEHHAPFMAKSDLLLCRLSASSL